MTKHVILAGLLGTLLAAGTGCHGLCQGRPLCPPCGGVDPQVCATGCGRCWGPAYGPAYGPACESDCGETACEPACGPIYGSPCGAPYGPLAWVFDLFRCHRLCGLGGCGERYWGEWHNDPPDCHDPCDRFGNWTGGGCGRCGVSGGYVEEGGYAEEGGGYVPVRATAAPSSGGGCTNCQQSRRVPTRAPRMVAQPDQQAAPTATYEQIPPRYQQARRAPVGTY